MSDAAELRNQLAALERPALAKTKASLRDAYKARSLSEFRAAFDACGMNQNELARHLGIQRSYVNDMLNGRREVQDWILRAMPREAKLVIAKGYVADVERDPSSVAGWR